MRKQHSGAEPLASASQSAAEPEPVDTPEDVQVGIMPLIILGLDPANERLHFYEAMSLWLAEAIPRMIPEYWFDN